MAETAKSRKLWPTCDARSVLTWKEMTEHFKCPAYYPQPEKCVALSYTWWCIQTGSMQCLTQMIDFLTSAKTPDPCSVREVLVGVMRTAVMFNSPSTVRHVLNYAKAKWSEEELYATAECLSGDCDCIDQALDNDEQLDGCACCNWFGCSYNWSKEESPCTILMSFLLARTEITDLLVEFAENLNVEVREQIYPHLMELEEYDVPPVRLLWAASAGNAKMVQRLLAQGADPNEDLAGDPFDRTPLMHSVYHKKPGMVANLIRAGASEAAAIHLCTPADMVVMASATSLLNVLCVENNRLINPSRLIHLGGIFNNVSFVKHIFTLCGPQFLKDHFADCVKKSLWPGQQSSVEMAELVLPHLVGALGEWSGQYVRLVRVAVKMDRPDLLRVFLSNETFYQNAVKADWYDILDSRHCSHTYPAVCCVRVLLGEGLCVNPRRDELPCPSVLHDAVEVNCTGLVKLYLRAGADSTALAYRGDQHSSNTFTPAQYARKKGHEECAELIEQFFPTLAQLCLWTVRLNLHKPMSKYVDSLCVPVELKHEIVLPWFDSMFMRYHILAFVPPACIHCTDIIMHLSTLKLWRKKRQERFCCLLCLFTPALTKTPLCTCFHYMHPFSINFKHTAVSVVYEFTLRCVRRVFFFVFFVFLFEK